MRESPESVLSTAGMTQNPKLEKQKETVSREGKHFRVSSTPEAQGLGGQRPLQGSPLGRLRGAPDPLPRH